VNEWQDEEDGEKMQPQLSHPTHKEVWKVLSVLDSVQMTRIVKATDVIHKFLSNLFKHALKKTDSYF
jgi:hypothetical protein